MRDHRTITNQRRPAQQHTFSPSTSRLVTRLTWADISVAVQIPIHWKFCHFVRIFAGLVTDLLLRDKKRSWEFHTWWRWLWDKLVHTQTHAVVASNNKSINLNTTEREIKGLTGTVTSLLCSSLIILFIVCMGCGQRCSPSLCWGKHLLSLLFQREINRNYFTNKN